MTSEVAPLQFPGYFGTGLMSLRDFEKHHRSSSRGSLPPPTLYEVVVSFIHCLISAPFLYGGLFMLPIIGQVMFFSALGMTVIYLYVRRSFLIIFTCLAANAVFIVPTMILTQLVENKNRFDVSLFLLIATCIPMSVFYILVLAGRAWFLVERRHHHESQPTRLRP